MSDGFLSRWARRKLQVRAAERRDPEAQAAPTGAGTDDPEVIAAIPADLPSDPPSGMPAEPRAVAPPVAVGEDPLADLPPLDALTPQSDLAPFLRAGVPTALRNAALRRMWSLDPTIRDFVSEAREYAYDWNSPGGVPGLSPLLPCDDVEAMLRRLVGALPDEVGEAPEPGAEVSADGAPQTGPALSDAEAGSRASEDSAGTELRDGDATPEEGARAVDASPARESGFAALGSRGEPLPLSEEQEGVQVAQPSRASAAPAQPRARLRRHGGAMPL